MKAKPTQDATSAQRTFHQGSEQHSQETIPTTNLEKSGKSPDSLGIEIDSPLSPRFHEDQSVEQDATTQHPIPQHHPVVENKQPATDQSALQQPTDYFPEELSDPPYSPKFYEQHRNAHGEGSSTHRQGADNDAQHAEWLGMETTRPKRKGDGHDNQEATEKIDADNLTGKH